MYGPPISLVGFDSIHARKINLRICTAETILEHPQEGKFLLRIHEAVHNPSAEDTLLSEFQLAEAGCKVDSKPTTHTYPNGSKGTQSFKLPKGDTLWHLNIDLCLITLPHRLPTPEERETLETFDITTPRAWEPKDFVTPGSSIAYANLTLSSNMDGPLKGLEDLMTLGDPKFGLYPRMKGNTKFFTALYASRHQTDSISAELVHPTLLGYGIVRICRH